MKTNTITRHLRCVLTEKELLEVSKQSAELTRAIVTLEDDKGRISKDFAARIAEREAARSVLTDKVLSGYEFRDVPCNVLLNHPKTGLKTIEREDTMELVATEQMTPDEMQEELLFNQEPSTVSAPMHPDDAEIDEGTRDTLLNSMPKSGLFKVALEQANLGTLKSALNACIADRVGGNKRKFLEEQIAKLEQAQAEPEAVEPRAEPGPGWFIWDEDGTCQNPIIVNVVGPCLIGFSIHVAMKPDSTFRRGFSIQDVEPDKGDLCDAFNYAFDTAMEAAACAYEDVLTWCEKGKARGNKEAAVTFRALSKKETRNKVMLGVESAVTSGERNTIVDLASE